MYSPQALKSKIDRLQHDRLVGLLESIGLFVVAFMFLGVIPQLVVRVLYPTQFPEQLPKMLELFLEHSPSVAIGFSLVYFIVVLVRNYTRARLISALEQDLEFASTVNTLDQDQEKDWLSTIDTTELETTEAAPAAKPAKKSGRKPSRKAKKSTE